MARPRGFRKNSLQGSWTQYNRLEPGKTTKIKVSNRYCCWTFGDFWWSQAGLKLVMYPRMTWSSPPLPLLSAGVKVPPYSVSRVLGTEPRTSHLLGEHSSNCTYYTSPAPRLGLKASNCFPDQVGTADLGESESGASLRFGAAVHFVSIQSLREDDQAERFDSEKSLQLFVGANGVTRPLSYLILFSNTLTS